MVARAHRLPCQCSWRVGNPLHRFPKNSSMPCLRACLLPGAMAFPPSSHSLCNGSRVTTAETTGNPLPLLVWVYAKQSLNLSGVTSHFDGVDDDDSNTATTQRHVFYCCAAAWLSGWLRLFYGLARNCDLDSCVGAAAWSLILF